MRPEVKWFAEQMEKTLQLHDESKGSDGWLNEEPYWLFERLEEEVEEVEGIISDPDEGFYIDPELLIKELTDIANFCMMIADRVRYE
jgi:NTP pyrophosphatase (non-canonical NTP hydrolase)